MDNQENQLMMSHKMDSITVLTGVLLEDVKHQVGENLHMWT